MTRRGRYIWGFVGFLLVISVVNRALNPNADTRAQTDPPIAKAEKPKSEAKLPAEKNDAALDEARHQFREYCIDAVRAKLQFPATFRGHYISAGPPWVVTRRSDHSKSWMWSFNFEASNGYGAVGRYTATCDQTPKGEVFAVITLAD